MSKKSYFKNEDGRNTSEGVSRNATKCKKVVIDNATKYEKANTSPKGINLIVIRHKVIGLILALYLHSQTNSYIAIILRRIVTVWDTISEIFDKDTFLKEFEEGVLNSITYPTFYNIEANLDNSKRTIEWLEKVSVKMDIVDKKLSKWFFVFVLGLELRLIITTPKWRIVKYFKDLAQDYVEPKLPP